MEGQDLCEKVDVKGALLYQGCRVLVTGGCGFIGSNLARALIGRGASVTIVDSLVPNGGAHNANVEDIVHHMLKVEGDVRDASLMSELLRNQDVVFNLAGQTGHVDSIEDPLTDLAVNVQAQLSMLENCRRVNPALHIVFTSTRQVYGRPDRLPVDESHPIRPPDVNAINKFSAECYHLLYGQLHGISSCVLRLTNIFGPGMRVIDSRQMFLGVWIRRILEGGTIQVFGDGSQRRDLLYVDDCVDALLRAGADPRSRGCVFNVSGKRAVTLMELGKMLVQIGESLGFLGRLECAPFPDTRKAIDIGDFEGDSSRIGRELGWFPTHPLEPALRHTIQYYADRLGRYLSPSRGIG